MAELEYAIKFNYAGIWGYLIYINADPSLSSWTYGSLKYLSTVSSVPVTSELAQRQAIAWRPTYPAKQRLPLGIKWWGSPCSSLLCQKYKANRNEDIFVSYSMFQCVRLFWGWTILFFPTQLFTVEWWRVKFLQTGNAQLLYHSLGNLTWHWGNYGETSLVSIPNGVFCRVILS